MKDKNERLDDLQNGYMLFQNPKQFCFGIDAVLLAWFAKAKPGERVLDMGTGTGIVPILMKARYPNWKSKKKVQSWQEEVSHIINWNRILIS